MPTIPVFFAWSGDFSIGHFGFSSTAAAPGTYLGQNVVTEPVATAPYAGSFCGALAFPNFTPAYVTGGARTSPPTAGFAVGGAFSDPGLGFSDIGIIGSITYPDGPRPDLGPLVVEASGFFWYWYPFGNPTPQSFAATLTILGPTTGHLRVTWSSTGSVIDGVPVEAPFTGAEVRLNGVALSPTIVVSGGAPSGTPFNYHDPGGGSHTCDLATSNCTLDVDVPLNTPYLDLRFTSTTEHEAWRRLKINPVAAFVDGGGILDASSSYALGDTISDYQAVYLDPISGTFVTLHSATPLLDLGLSIDANLTVTLTTTNTQGCANVTSGVIATQGPRHLLHDPHLGSLHYAYIAVPANETRVARTLQGTSFGTSGDSLARSNAAATGGPYLFRSGTALHLCVMDNRQIVLARSLNEGVTWTNIMTVASNVLIAAARFIEHTQTLIVVVRDTGGNMQRAAATHNGNGTWTAQTVTATTGLPAGLQGIALDPVGDALLLTAKSGTNITLYQSLDNGFTWAAL